VEAHLAHLAGSFRAAGWEVTDEQPRTLNAAQSVAVLDDPWIEAFPRAALTLAAARGDAASWRIPRVSGGPGSQGWAPRRGPYTLHAYRRHALERNPRCHLPPPRPWTGFAVAPAPTAGEVLAAGWPPAPDRVALVPQVRLYRYQDPADHDRAELEPFIPARARWVLDIGCGHGRLGQRLREGGRRVIGIEPDWTMARVAARRLDLVLPGTAEEVLPALGHRVDCIILADVLEHLPDPAAVLRRCRRALAADGLAVVSFPSLTWAPVLRELAAGRFETTLAGVQARDHLAVLAPRSFPSFAAAAGFHTRQLVPLPAPLSWRLRAWARLVAWSAGGRAADLLSPQWVAVLAPR
jgi:2-polyprenyl-3-methyl-5-hydroxy-6-metoxy-1,4-benzoquinol methylase